MAGRISIYCVPKFSLQAIVNRDKATAKLHWGCSTVSPNVRINPDLLARYGGEEFAVILPDTDAAGARRVIEHIYAAIKEKAIGHKSSDVSSVITISAGIATCCAEIDQMPDLIIELAAQALYRANARGRDCYILEPPSPLLEGQFATSAV